MNQININLLLSRIDEKYIEKAFFVDNEKKLKEMNRIRKNNNKNDIVREINNLVVGSI